MVNHSKSLYSQLEEVIQKLDKSIEQNEDLKLTIYNLNWQIENLTKELQQANEIIEKQQNEIDRLKNQNNKNSTNSSKSSSTNIVTPKKKTGANLYNYRVKSGKKVGGQIGHEGHNLSKKEIEELIDDKKIEVRTIYHEIKGNPTKEPIVKYRLGIETKAFAEKHIFKFSSSSKEKLPESFYTDVTYDNSIKTLSIELGAYNVISYERLSDYFNVITDGVLEISNGTLVNFLYEFSDKSKSTIEELESDFLNGTIGYTDETGTKFNGKKMYIRNYSNKQTVVYKAHLHKGHKPIKEDNLLPRFLGGIMGDHDTTLYSYGTKNYECNIHTGRYLKELMENIPDTKWPFLMYDLLFRMNNTRKIAMEYGLKKFEKKKIKEYEDEYVQILKLAKEENKHISSSYYRTNKAIPLYNRLKKYKKNHLYFIKDFKVPFDDNLSEQDLRIFKNKTKISGGFRSMKAAECYVDALSIIKTSIKRNINPFESIKAIFNNQILFN